MRFLLLIGASLTLIAASCGGGTASAESVVRAWSSALNAGDNESAADLFATNAEIIQGGAEHRFSNHADAVEWNAALPCSGRIVRIEKRGDDVTATFVLGDRRTSRCDGPGVKARAVIACGPARSSSGTRCRSRRPRRWNRLPSSS